MLSENQKRKIRRMRHDRGIANWIPPEPAIKRVRLLHDTYLMPLDYIAELAYDPELGRSLSRAAVSDLYRGTYRKARRVTVRAVLSIPVPDAPLKPPDGCKGALRAVPACAVTRRVDALALQGFPIKWVCQTYVGTAFDFRIYKNKYVQPSLYYKYVAAFRELNGKDPNDFGISKYAQSVARNTATKRNAVPEHCWDDDTIDDPDAIAQWTGECGTSTGYGIHRKEEQYFWKFFKQAPPKLVIGCTPCRKANSDAKRRVCGDERSQTDRHVF